MINIHEKVGNVQVDIDIEDKVCLLPDDSGAGKTFLMTVINQILGSVEAPYINVWSYYPVVTTVDDIQFAKVFLLDNADLYLTNKLLAKFANKCEHVITAIRNYAILGGVDYMLYDVFFEDNKLVCKRSKL